MADSSDAVIDLLKSQAKVDPEPSLVNPDLVTLSDDEFAKLVTQIVNGGHVRSVTRNGWNDLNPVDRTTGVDPQPKQ